MKTEAKKFTIGIQVINVTCPCGGACENENGSTMIEYFDNVVWCGECQERFVVPESAFKKSHVSPDYQNMPTPINDDSPRGYIRSY